MKLFNRIFLNFLTLIEQILNLVCVINNTERERLPPPSNERAYDRSYPPLADRFADRDTRETYPPRSAAYKRKPAGTELFKSIVLPR